MSWWESGEADDWVGDASADAAGDALDEIVKSRQQAGRTLPTLEEYVDALAAALLFFVGMEKLPPVKATLDGGSSVEASASRTADGGVVGPLLDAARNMNGAYQDFLGRPARPSEVVASIDFVLGAAPQKYLQNGEGLRFKIGLNQ